MKLTDKQRSEFKAKEYYGEDEVAKMKRHLESMLSFRNSVKGAPDVYLKAQLALDKPFITMYNNMIYGIR